MKKILKRSVIKIKKVACLRDLGGLPTADGKHIKYGLIYKSSHLGKVDDAAKLKLVNDLKISKDIDLRSPSELIDKPDQEIAGVEYVHLPVLGDDDNPAVNKDSRDEVLESNMAEEGGSRGHITRIYRKMINNKDVMSRYRLFLDELIKSDGKPVVYHCTQGKDRTGVATMLFLLALGVDKEVIIKDYLHYNVVNRRMNNLYTFGVAVGCLSIKKARGLRNLLVTRREYLEAAFEEIDKLGGVDNYLANYLGLNSEYIDKLKNIYLE